MGEDVIIGARRKYPGGAVKSAGDPPPAPPVGDNQVSTVPNSGVTTMHGKIVVSIALVENGYLVEIDGKSYIAPNSDQLAVIVANVVESRREVIIPGGMVESEG